MAKMYNKTFGYRSVIKPNSIKVIRYIIFKLRSNIYKENNFSRKVVVKLESRNVYNIGLRN